MIVDGRLSIPRVIVSLGQPLLLTLAASLLVTTLYEWDKPAFLDKIDAYLSISGTPLTVVGAALSIFIGFRNNTVYDRWWEGRNLWGALINQSRTFARQITTFAAYTSEHGDKKEMKAWQRRAILRHIGFVHAFRNHLRDTDPLGANGCEPFVTPGERELYATAHNVPSAILHEQGSDLHEAWRRGWIQDFHLNALEDRKSVV